MKTSPSAALLGTGSLVLGSALITYALISGIILVKDILTAIGSLVIGIPIALFIDRWTERQRRKEAAQADRKYMAVVTHQLRDVIDHNSATAATLYLGATKWDFPLSRFQYDLWEVVRNGFARLPIDVRSVQFASRYFEGVKGAQWYLELLIREMPRAGSMDVQNRAARERLLQMCPIIEEDGNALRRMLTQA